MSRADGQALAELERRPTGLPAGLEVEWLGVSGYRITSEGSTLRRPLSLPRPASEPAARADLA